MTKKIKIRQTNNKKEWNDISTEEIWLKISIPNLALRLLSSKVQKESSQLDKFTAKLRSKQTTC